MRESWLYWLRSCNFTEGAVCIVIVLISFLFVWATGLTFIRVLALASASALILVLWLDVFISFPVEDGVEEGLKFVWEDHSVFRYWTEGMLVVRQYCQLKVFIALYSRFSRYSRAPALEVI